MPRKKHSNIRDAALRREAKKRGEATPVVLDIEVLDDPMYEPPNQDVGVQPDTNVDHVNEDKVNETELSFNNKEIGNEMRPLLHVKRKHSHENSDILPERSRKVARTYGTTEWRNANGKTKKARAALMQPSIASIFKVKPSQPKSISEVQNPSHSDAIIIDCDRSSPSQSTSTSEAHDVSSHSDSVMIECDYTGPCQTESFPPPTEQNADSEALSLRESLLGVEIEVDETSCELEPMLLDAFVHDDNAAAEIADIISSESLPAEIETALDENQISDLSDKNFILVHGALTKHVAKFMVEFRKKDMNDNGVRNILLLEALSQYIDLRLQLTVKRNSLRDRLKDARGAIKLSLKKQLASIRPATDASETIADRHGKTRYYARRLRSITLHIHRTGEFPESQQGKGAHHESNLDDPDVKRAVENWLKGEIPFEQGGFNGGIKAPKLRRYVNEFLFPSLQIEDTISLTTAVSWLKRLGFEMSRVKKGVYVDGHERPDVKQSLSEFLNTIYDQVLPFAHKYDGDDLSEEAPILADGQKVHYPIFHDETCFHANDLDKVVWKRNGEEPLRSKSRGRIIHTSDFIIEACGRLVLNEEEISAQMKLPVCPERPTVTSKSAIVPEVATSDGNNTGRKGQKKGKKSTNQTNAGRTLQEQDNQWIPPPPPAPFTSYRLKSFDARRIIHPGSNYDPWWDMGQLLTQTKDAIEIFNTKFPEGVAVFIFDCSSAHEAFASDALLAQKMNRGPGGQQPVMHDTINPLDGTVQSMVFSSNYRGVDKENNLLAGKPKGMEQILRERGLLSALQQKHGKKLAGVCKTCKLSQAKREAALKEARSKQDEIEGSGDSQMNSRGVSDLDNDDVARPTDCCMQRVLSLQPDFRAEKPLLQLVIEKAGHKCLFLPKFHCELNPIEMVWCLAKQKFRSLADETFKTAQKLVPQCLNDISVTQIRKFFRHCWRYMSAYKLGLNLKQAAFAVKKYSSHRRVPISILNEHEIISRAAAPAET